LRLARRVHYRPIVGLRRHIVALALALAGCDPDDDDASVPVTRDALAAVDADAAQIRLLDRMLRKVDLTGVAAGAAGPEIAAQVRAGLEADLADPGCMTVAGDAGVLALSFDRCRHPAAALLDGDLRLDLAGEAGTCGGDPCVAAIVAEIAAADLRIGGNAILEAAASLRVPARGDEPRTRSSAGALRDRQGRELAVGTDVAWSYAGGCVTADFGVEVAADDRRIAVSGEAVKICDDRCPEAGAVLISWDAGRTLGWTYTGKGELEVHGPGGRVFAVELACADADP
jgi:hypothetical protein